ncbi:hypothetical protein K470DRAFT_262089 [Piedraia hortae CBS 480.64]|uniref:Myb-like domain-containing protein n=1 Tax=Piedraia hortae CBS 480.64 TaxID=1314780 RepID=A0A6A7C726_9PEZI|nr:hypothetical protein K470DRAFT_262089 [Piedraia hortae CBS 480.64]
MAEWMPLQDEIVVPEQLHPPGYYLYAPVMHLSPPASCSSFFLDESCVSPEYGFYQPQEWMQGNIVAPPPQALPPPPAFYPVPAAFETDTFSTQYDSSFDFGSAGGSVAEYCTPAPTEISGDDVVSVAEDDQAEPPLSRRKLDSELVRLRQHGMSYSKIRKALRCSEAEATLRGRHRMLITRKEDRLRKPVWQDTDEHLLYRAVAVLARPQKRTGRVKPPWKKISEWMRDNGASYKFSAAACSKRWRTLNYR